MNYKCVAVAALMVAMLPAVASADYRGRYDRGDRYRHSYRHRDHDRGKFSFSFGFGSHGYRDYSYFNLGYGRGHYPRYHRSYHSPRVIYRDTYYHAPARVYVPPPRVYYYDSCGPTYYHRRRYHYGY